MNREAKVDCALAELYTRSLATERMLEQQKQAEVITKLYVRMNEVSLPTALLLKTLTDICLITLSLTAGPRQLQGQCSI